MGWLFGKKKKVPKVPLPEGRPFDQSSLRFPNKIATDKIIHSDDIKEATGTKRPLIFPEENEMTVTPKLEFPREPTQLKPIFAPALDEPLFLKVDVYQRILGEFGEIKHNLNELNNINKQLEKSEFNEENNFNKLKRMVTVMHDRLLQADKTLFKGD